MKNYIYIETYGCSANQNNSEILAGLLTQSGYQITNNPTIADMIILNTCIVKGKTENKIKRRIQDLKEINKPLIITGCMPETDAKQIQQLNPKAILLGTHNFKEIIKLINDYNENKLTKNRQKTYLKKQDEEKLLLPKIPKNRLISITQISEGCLGNCTYCKTRLAKHKLFSYDEDKILTSIESDLRSGAKEIWITSQDNAAYGMDKGEPQLPNLLRKILSLKHNFKLRLGMMNPNNLIHIQDEILDLYHNKKMYKFLHVPIQSASNKVLKDMNRQYKIKKAEEIIDRFRRNFPNITIATDIIVGYPTETQSDHEHNLRFLHEFRPDIFNLSKFSRHKQTSAEKLKELDIKIINKRTTELMNVHKSTALQNKRKFLGKETTVFVNKKMPGFYEARDNSYNIVLVKSNEPILGKNIKVKIQQIAVHHMFAEVQ